jgi:hypothetical protein
VGRELHDALAMSLTGLDALNRAPLGAPIALTEETVIPIEQLLYRGRAALERARELRETLRGTAQPSPDQLQELYDLIELAATE